MSVRVHELTDRVAARIHTRLDGDEREAGMVASEYVMGTAVAAGCVGVVFKVVTSPQFLGIVKAFIVHKFHLFD